MWWLLLKQLWQGEVFLTKSYRSCSVAPKNSSQAYGICTFEHTIEGNLLADCQVWKLLSYRTKLNYNLIKPHYHVLWCFIVKELAFEIFVYFQLGNVARERKTGLLQWALITAYRFLPFFVSVVIELFYCRGDFLTIPTLQDSFYLKFRVKPQSWLLLLSSKPWDCDVAILLPLGNTHVAVTAEV